MSAEAKLMCGIILFIIPTIQFGGYFLLTVVTGRFTAETFTDFQKTFFRAGHAHAGVITLLSLVCQLLADWALLSPSAEWLVRAGVPLSAVLLSGGFFFSALGKDREKPGGWLGLLYAGAVLLAVSVITLGIGLLRG